MNRFKLICLVVILTLIAILWVQNSQKLLALEFFCPGGVNQSCLYLTPPLPLAAWMLIFAIAGLLSSLIWQFLSQVGSSQKKQQISLEQPRPIENKINNSNRRRENLRPQSQSVASSSKQPISDWEQKSSEDWESDEISAVNKERISTNQKVEPIPPQTPAKKSSDSVYSYNFREQQKPKNSESSIPQDRKVNQTDDVYDAPYRTVNPPSKSDSNVSEDDEQWI